MLLASCAGLSPKMQHPEVKLVGLRLLPSHGLLEQRVAIDLNITNPNAKDLSVRGITYNIGIENINILSGATDQVPVLKSYQETPVTLEVSADIVQILRLVEHYNRNGVSDNVNYNFSAVIDFSAWLPSMHVDRKGAVPLRGKSFN
jgi:LEA14-like dessication related protein